MEGEKKRKYLIAIIIILSLIVIRLIFVTNMQATKFETLKKTKESSARAATRTTNKENQDLESKLHQETKDGNVVNQVDTNNEEKSSREVEECNKKTEILADEKKTLTEQIDTLTQQIKEQDTKITEQDTKIKEQDTKIKEQDTDIVKKDTKITEQDTEIKKQDTKITKKDTKIYELHKLTQLFKEELKNGLFKKLIDYLVVEGTHDNTALKYIDKYGNISSYIQDVYHLYNDYYKSHNDATKIENKNILELFTHLPCIRNSMSTLWDESIIKQMIDSSDLKVEEKDVIHDKILENDWVTTLPTNNNTIVTTINCFISKTLAHDIEIEIKPKDKIIETIKKKYEEYEAERTKIKVIMKKLEQEQLERFRNNKYEQDDLFNALISDTKALFDNNALIVKNNDLIDKIKQLLSITNFN